jgi:hypothetical protein
VPVAAARLADVGARDSQPLVLGRCCQHFLEQIAVAGLQLVLLAKRYAGLANPRRQSIANALELIEARHPRLAKSRRNARIERQPGKGLRAEARELVLEPADLAAQLNAREALVASHSKRCKHVSIEQIWHRPKIECKSPGRG